MGRAILFVAVVLLVAAVVAGGAGIAYLGRQAEVGGPVYTASQVEAGLRRDPGSWVGRSIRLRAAVLPFMQPCPPPAPRPCGTAYPLADIPPPPQRGAGLVVRNSLVFFSNWLQLHPTADPLLSQVRRIPLLGRLVPAPQPIPREGIYAVTIRHAPTSPFCRWQPCYWAVLPDADPTLNFTYSSHVISGRARFLPPATPPAASVAPGR